MSFGAYQKRNSSNSENETLGAFHAESPIAAIVEQILHVASRVFWTANILPDKSRFCEYFLWTNSGDSPLSVSQIKCPHRTVALFNWHEYKSHLTLWLKIMSNKGAHTTRRLFFLVIDLAFYKIEPWFSRFGFPSRENLIIAKITSSVMIQNATSMSRNKSDRFSFLAWKVETANGNLSNAKQSLKRARNVCLHGFETPLQGSNFVRGEKKEWNEITVRKIRVENQEKIGSKVLVYGVVKE